MIQIVLKIFHTSVSNYHPIMEEIIGEIRLGLFHGLSFQEISLQFKELIPYTCSVEANSKNATRV